MIYETQKILGKNTHPYIDTNIFQSMKIPVWLGKTFEGFTKLNPVSDYGELSSDDFSDLI